MRRIAQRAGVTPALLHYYFGGPDGLLEALLAERVAPPLNEAMAHARLQAVRPQQALTRLMQRTTWLLASDPLLRRALWLSPAQGLRDALRTCLRELLVRAQEAGTLRVDLDPDYLAGTLLGLMLFPFLDGNPPALASGAAQLMLQHIALLRDGIVRADSPGRRRR